MKVAPELRTIDQLDVEVARNIDLTKAEVWSTGSIAFDLAGLNPPYAANDSTQMPWGVETDPSFLVVSATTSAFVSRMLEWDTDRRLSAVDAAAWARVLCRLCREARANERLVKSAQQRHAAVREAEDIRNQLRMIHTHQVPTRPEEADPLLTQVAIVIGGKGPEGSEANDMLVFDLENESWHSLAYSGEQRQHPGVCLMPDGNIFVCGGSRGDDVLCSAQVYCTTSGQWRSLPAMPQPRVGCQACVCGGQVMVIGGHDGEDDHRSVIVYVEETGRWQEKAQMSHGRSFFGLCKLTDATVLVVGGSDGTTRRSVERYSMETDSWELLPQLRDGREGCACVMSAGYGGPPVLVVGGLIEEVSTASLDAVSSTADSAPALPPMAHGRAYPGVVSVGDEVFVCGGWDSTICAPLVSCEVLADGAWRAATPMPVARAGHGTVAAHISRRLIR